jgi:ATP synthase F1 delta subunit
MIIIAETLAQKYATAFFNVFGKKFSHQVIENIGALEKFLNKNNQFLAYLTIPTMSEPIKKQLITKVITHFKLEEEFKTLICLLIKHKRHNLLPLILKHIKQEYQSRNSIAVFSIATSHTLQEQEKQRIIYFIQHALPKQTIQASFTLAPELISGIRIKSQTLLWERSINKLLRHVKQTMFQRVGL